MPPEQDEYVFPHPWLDLRGHGGDEAATRDRLERELLVEVGPEHPLAQRPVKASAHFTRQDEVLLAADSGYVIAHLTWAGRHDPFVTVRDLTDWTRWLLRLRTWPPTGDGLARPSAVPISGLRIAVLT